MLLVYRTKIMRAIICITLFYNISHSQWSELTLPQQSVPFYMVNYPMGDDCMIFSIDTSNTIYGFDQNSKAWSSYTAETSLDWENSAGGGKTCVVYNDSVAVAYSSVLSQFSELKLEGTLLIPASGWTKCNENCAVILTSEKIYIYNALTNTWTSTAMTDYGLLSLFGNHIQEKFLYITLVFSNGNTRIVAYSFLTQTFAEITETNFFIHRLDHGFCLIAGSGPSFIVGYSASTGVFTKISSADLEFYDSSPATDNEKVSEVILQMFYTLSAPDGDGNITQTNYVYNTVTGQFYTNPYTYSPAATAFYLKVGGRFAVCAMYDKVEYKITLKIFRSSDNSFYSLEVPLHIVSLTPGLLTAGGEVFWIWDDTYLIAVNATTGATGQVLLNDSFATTPSTKALMAGDDWGVWAYRNTDSDTVRIFYFSDDVTSIGYKEVVVSLGVTYDQYDKIGFISFQDAGSVKKWSAYSPSHNAWHDFESTTSTGDYQTIVGNYVYVNYISKSRLELFDAVTNEVHIYPHATSLSYLKYKKDYVIAYNASKQYVGYSVIEHDDQIYQVDKYYSLTNTDDIALITPTGTLLDTSTRIIYDGYRNNFAGLKIADSLGTVINGGQSSKFCFFATMTGHVFAYTGENGNLVSVEQNPRFSPAEYSLGQNYPNPFNPTTEIRFSVGTYGHISLRVYDILGREVATLVDEKKPAGSYQVPWDASGFSSGVYFYKLSTGKYLHTKKMLLIK